MSIGTVQQGNAAAAVLHALSLVPETDALYGTSTVRAGELAEKIRAVAGSLLASGVVPGERVVLICGNIPEFVSAYFGILLTGGVAVPLSPQMTATAASAIAGRVNAKIALLCAGPDDQDAQRCAEFERVSGVEKCFWINVAGSDGIHGPALPGASPARASESRPDAPACMIFTSGTTGQSKGVVLSHRAMLSAARGFAARLGTRPGERMLVSMPLNTSFGQVSLMTSCLLSGKAMDLMPRYSGEAAWRGLLLPETTMYIGVPTMYLLMLKAEIPSEEELASINRHVRMMGIGGSPVAQSLMDHFRDDFGLELREGYGLSETSSVTTFHGPDEPVCKGSAGRAIPGARLLVVDDAMQPVPTGELGEVLVAGDHLMSGYHDMPDATEAAFQDGWLRTGDLGRLDEGGYLHITDRIKDLIIRGGQNIYPSEIESVLMAYPGVNRAAVVGRPHPVLGEEVVAFLETGIGNGFDERAFLAWAAERLPAIARPKAAYVLDAIPLGATGKMLKRELRNMIPSQTPAT